MRPNIAGVMQWQLISQPALLHKHVKMNRDSEKERDEVRWNEGREKESWEDEMD